MHERGKWPKLYESLSYTQIDAQLRHAFFKPALENMAHALVYEATLTGDMPQLSEHLPSISVPALVISGGNSQTRVRSAAQTLAGALPNAQHRSLSGQTHDIVPEILASLLEAFFKG